MWYTFFKYVLFVPVCRVVFRPRVIGRENVPATGGVVMAANHISAGDTFLLPAMIRRRMTFAAKAELFRGDRGFGSKVIAWFLKAVGQVPMDRSGGRASASGLSPVAQVLADGGIVGIFPEGTRSPDGRLYKGKTGVARLALNNDVPVIPVGMADTEFVKGWFGIPTIRRPRITIGKPIAFGSLDEDGNVAQQLRETTNAVMREIQAITGQEYVDAFASSIKAGRVTAESAPVLPYPGADAESAAKD